MQSLSAKVAVVTRLRNGSQITVPLPSSYTGGVAGIRTDDHYLSFKKAGITLSSTAGTLTVTTINATSIVYTVNSSSFLAEPTDEAVAVVPLLIPLPQFSNDTLDDFIKNIRSTQSPNASIPVHMLVAAGQEANIDIAITPRGNGAVIAGIAPNSASSGGNKRGTNAVDLQISRGSASQAATGTRAVISGGGSNTSSATESVVAGGTTNVASANYASVGGGTTNTASAVEAVVCGGSNNTASGIDSVVAGGKFGTTRGITGAFAFAGVAAALGQTQFEYFVLRAVTAAITATRLTVDAAAAAAANGVTPPNSSLYAFSGIVAGRDTVTNDVSVWKIEGVLKRGAAAANTALVGTPTITLIQQDAAMAAAAVAITADTTLGQLNVTVTPHSANSTRWVAKIETTEIA